MSYGPVNRKTLASVNRVNRQVQDEQGRDPDGKFGSGGGKVPFGHRSKDPGNKNDPMKKVPFGHRSKDPNQDSDLQEPQDPGESNDAMSLQEQVRQYISNENIDIEKLPDFGSPAFVDEYLEQSAKMGRKTKKI